MAGKRNFFCGSPDHAIDRRGFLGSAAALGTAALTADMTQLNVLTQPALAAEMKQQQKRVILLWLAGGSSQLETWDPKPGAVTGGPFRAIQTTVPGVYLSELMPKMAARMKNFCILRGLNTKDGDHGGASLMMMRGRRDEPNLKYPDLGAVLARELGKADSKVPDYVSMYFATEGRGFAPGATGFLGSRYGSMNLYKDMIPENIRKSKDISDLDHVARADLREFLSRQFNKGRGGATLGSHNEAYQRVRGLMASEKLFDISLESQKARDAYGPTLFGQQALCARRLVEAGTPFVRVGRAWWDSHGQNFETHQEMVPELDHVMATLIDDLKERGLFENTLIVTLAEFGRTPNINSSLGRDHFASAWSVTLTGCGIQGGAVYGKSDPLGHKVVDGEIGAGELFATIYKALGINPNKNYYVGSRPVPLVNPHIKFVKEVLA